VNPIYYYFIKRRIPREAVISPAPPKAPRDGISLAYMRPHPYPAATPINVRIEKMAVGNLGIEKKRKKYPKKLINILNNIMGIQTFESRLIVSPLKKIHAIIPKNAAG